MVTCFLEDSQQSHIFHLTFSTPPAHLKICPERVSVPFIQTHTRFLHFRFHTCYTTRVCESNLPARPEEPVITQGKMLSTPQILPSCFCQSIEEEGGTPQPASFHLLEPQTSLMRVMMLSSSKTWVEFLTATALVLSQGFSASQEAETKALHLV